jgi:hypothetical protein
MKKSASYINIKAVLILSTGFFILIVPFNSVVGCVGKALKDNGFDNLGYYSMSVFYLGIGLSCLWAP